eukprot:g41149.t1
MSTVTTSTSSMSVNTDCSDSERPVSVASSGSLPDWRGADGTPPPGTHAPDAGLPAEECVRVELAPPLRALKADRVCNNNNNIIPGRRTPDGSYHQVPLSPIATRAMAPNPKLSYVDRVVMEIIETERMYVQDLRSIIEDGGKIIDKAAEDGWAKESTLTNSSSDGLSPKISTIFPCAGPTEEVGRSYNWGSRGIVVFLTLTSTWVDQDRLLVIIAPRNLMLLTISNSAPL